MFEEQQKKICSSHQHSFRFYCLSCQQELCSDCFAFFHDRTHPIILLSDLNNPDLNKIHSKLKEVDKTLNNYNELYGDTKQTKLQLLEEMKENNIRYLDRIKENMSRKYDEIINRIKHSKQTQTPIISKLKDKQSMLKQMLRSLKSLQSNLQDTITPLFQEIDALQKEYSGEANAKCNSFSMISFTEWAKYQEMSFKFDNYKEDVKSPNEYHIGFCNWNLELQKEDDKLGAVFILNKDCLKNIDDQVNFMIAVELVNQKQESITFKESCCFTKDNNKKIIPKMCSLNDLEKKGFADENGVVEIKVKVRFKEIDDFLTMQQFGLVQEII